MARPSPRSSHPLASAAVGGAGDNALRLPILLVTPADDLWTALAAATGGRDSKQFDSAAELVSEWPALKPAVVLIDAREGDLLESAVAAVLGHGSCLVPVAIVDEATRELAVRLERRRTLFDHLRMPLDGATARTVLDRAAEEAAARRSLAAGDPGGASGPVDPLSPPAPRRRPWLLVAGAVGLVLAAAAAWWLTRPGPAPELARVPAPPTSATASRPVAPAVAVPAEQVEAELERARAAMRDKRYIDPAADNALLHYKSVLDLVPDNGEARQGLDRIAELLIARAGSAMASRDYAGALRALEAARTLNPGHPRLPALDAQVSQHLKDLSGAQVQAALQANAFARAATLLAQAEKTGALPAEQIAQLRAEAARRESSAQLADLARLALARIGQGRLSESGSDSARFYLRQLQDRGGEGVAETVARLQDLYGKRAVADAHAAMARGAFAEADAIAADLRGINGTGPGQSLQREIDKARELSKAHAASETAPPAEPTHEPAAPAATPVSAPPQAVTAPRLLKSLALDYPPRAASAGTEGWVEIEFDVTPGGSVENPHVLGAAPEHVFENAAVNAIRRARFAPAQAVDGTPVRTTTRLKVRFALSGQK